MDDLSKRVTKIKEKSEKLHDRKIRLEERLKSEKAALAKVVQEIKEKGYDPKKLKKTAEEKKKELEEIVDKVNSALDKAEEVLNEIEREDAGTSE